MKKQLIWVFEWRKSVHYWWSYILFSPECKESTGMLDPLLYRWSAPPVVIRCVHWTMQMEVLQTWIKAQGLAIVMYYSLNQILPTAHNHIPLIPSLFHISGGFGHRSVHSLCGVINRRFDELMCISLWRANPIKKGREFPALFRGRR